MTSRYQRARRYIFWRGFTIAMVVWTIFSTAGAILVAE